MLFDIETDQRNVTLWMKRFLYKFSTTVMLQIVRLQRTYRDLLLSSVLVKFVCDMKRQEYQNVFFTFFLSIASSKNQTFWWRGIPQDPWTLWPPVDVRAEGKLAGAVQVRGTIAVRAEGKLAGAVQVRGTIAVRRCTGKRYSSCQGNRCLNCSNSSWGRILYRRTDYRTWTFVDVTNHLLIGPLNSMNSEFLEIVKKLNSFCRKFFKTPNFEGWLRHRQQEIGKKLELLHLEVLCKAVSNHIVRWRTCKMGLLLLLLLLLNESYCKPRSCTFH